MTRKIKTYGGYFDKIVDYDAVLDAKLGKEGTPERAHAEESDKTFETNSFWSKNKFLLLMFYLHESGVDPVDMLFKLIRTWTFPEEDLKIIRDDWNKMHSMILDGKADELTEGLTFYPAA